MRHRHNRTKVRHIVGVEGLGLGLGVVLKVIRGEKLDTDLGDGSGWASFLETERM